MADRLSDRRLGGAVKWCGESRAKSGTRLDWTAQNRLIEAMALHQLGKTDDANTAFQEALESFEAAFPDDPTKLTSRTGWIDYVDCLILRREAEQQFGVPKQADDVPSETDRPPSVEGGD